MDGDAVSQPSDADGGEPAPKTYTEVFVKAFPAYLVMGMTYQQFWHGQAWLAKAYRDAYQMQQRNAEWDRWRQGAYFYDALLRVAPVMRASFSKTKVEPGKYPDEPWPLTAKEAQEREEAKRRRTFERMLAKMNAESERNKKELSEDGRH